MARDHWWGETMGDAETAAQGDAAPRAPRAAPARRGRPRRRATAGAALAAMLLGFFLAGLLDAAALKRDAETQPIGARRTALLWLVRPVVALSGAVWLDEPARALDRALGRDDEGAHRSRAELAAADAPPIWPRDVSASEPLRLYVAGDSMAGQFGGPFAALAEGTGLMRARVDYHVSSGLSRPEYFDWPQRLIDKVLDSRAEAIVFLVGGNDAQRVEWDGRVLELGSRDWLDVYRLRVAEAMDIATSGGRRLYWVGQPIMRDGLYDERMAMLNRVYEEEAAKQEGAMYIDSRELFSNGDGKYTAYLKDAGGDLVRMRQADGIHLTRAGADHLGAHVLEVVREDWGMTEAAQ